MRLFCIFFVSLFLLVIPSCMSTEVPAVPVQDSTPTVELSEPSFVQHVTVSVAKYQQWLTLAAYVLSIILVTLQARKNGQTATPQETEAAYKHAKGHMKLLLKIFGVLLRKKK